MCLHRILPQHVGKIVALDQWPVLEVARAVTEMARGCSDFEHNSQLQPPHAQIWCTAWCATRPHNCLVNSSKTERNVGQEMKEEDWDEVREGRRGGVMKQTKTSFRSGLISAVLLISSESSGKDAPRETAVTDVALQSMLQLPVFTACRMLHGSWNVTASYRVYQLIKNKIGQHASLRKETVVIWNLRIHMPAWLPFEICANWQTWMTVDNLGRWRVRSLSRGTT